MTVDVVRTWFDIARGLSDRTSMGEQEGMLFIVDEPMEFWMKHMLIPIDMIWMNKEHIVVSVLHNAQPCPTFGDCPKYMPNSEFSYVLETVAGFAEKNDIGPGTKIPFQINQ